MPLQVPDRGQPGTPGMIVRRSSDRIPTDRGLRADRVGAQLFGALAGPISGPGMAYWMIACSVYLYIAHLGVNIHIYRVECDETSGDQRYRGAGAGGARSGLVWRGRLYLRPVCRLLTGLTGLARHLGEIGVQPIVFT